MNNYNIEMLKLLYLNQYDLNRDKTTIFVEGDNITAHLYFNPTDRTCPYCKSIHTNIHARITKNISHPVLAGKNCIIILHQIKFKCVDCGHYYLQYNPIAPTSKNISYEGEITILNALRRQGKTFKEISEDYHIPYTSTVRCFDEHVCLNRHNLTKVVCFDEIYSDKLTNTKYAFVMYDPLSKTLLDVLDARLKSVLTDYFARIPVIERLKVEYVNIDMWETYLSVSQQSFPKAVICVDSFHVIKHLNEAMDKIRLQVQKRFVDKKDSDRNGYYWLLKTFHYYFVQDFDNIKYTRKPNSHYGYLADKHAVLDKILSIDSNLKEAYLLKERYREFNKCATYDIAKTKLDDFIEEFKKSYYSEFREFGGMLERWRDNIINSFITVNGKRMSNGPMESLNGRIRRLIVDGYGFTNFERFRNRVLFCLNQNEPLKFEKK